MYATIESRSMLVGAAAFVLYSVVCCQLMLREKFRAAPVTIAALVLWLSASLGGWAVFFRSLRKTEWSEYAVRFIFGGAISIIAAELARHFGPAFG